MTPVYELPLIGVHPAATDLSMPLLDLAREAEARGLRSIYFPEHTHIPVTSVYSNGRTMPERYKRVMDPYIASAFVAASTSLEVGTAVSLIAQHDAIALAKAIATLDYLSEGRTVVGVGFGYNRPEAADHGVPVRERAVVVEETVRLMRALWSEDEAEFEGQFRRVSRSWAWPKPFSPGGPPILLGARATARNFDRIVSWADGWIPMGTGPNSPTFPEELSDLRQRWSDGGRAGAPQVCCFFQPGSADEMASQIERGGEAGVQRMQVFLGDLGREEALPILDDIAAVIKSPPS